MKHTFTFSVILPFLILITACDKSTQPAIDTKLTDCPANSACSFSFQDKADFAAPNKVVAGNDIVFYYSSTNTKLCNATNRLYFKTSVAGNSFTINGNEIAENKVMYNFVCPCCDYISLKPIGGEIKGQKINSSTWLVNVNVILGNTQANIKDTIRVNQYFKFSKITTQ